MEAWTINTIINKIINKTYFSIHDFVFLKWYKKGILKEDNISIKGLNNFVISVFIYG